MFDASPIEAQVPIGLLGQLLHIDRSNFVRRQMTFDRLVFWSGVWNVGLGLTLITPPITRLLGVQIPDPFWPWIVSGFLVHVRNSDREFSRRVEQYASIIYWEALLRFFAVAVFLTVYGFTYVGILPSHCRSPISHGVPSTF